MEGFLADEHWSIRDIEFHRQLLGQMDSCDGHRIKDLTFATKEERSSVQAVAGPDRSSGAVVVLGSG